MISEEEIKQLEELERKALPGPWEAYSSICCPDMGGISSGKRTVCDDKVGVYGHPMAIENAEFMEAARNILPRLLDGYREMQAQLLHKNRELEGFKGEAHGEIETLTRTQTQGGE